MSKRFELEKYGLDSYDDYLCLRPSWPLIAALVFLCRGLVAVAVLGVSGELPAGWDEVVNAETVRGDCFAAVPAALVLYALGARLPSARAFVRSIWRHGRVLMLVSAVAYVGLAAERIGFDARSWLNTSGAVKALMLIELGIIGYVLFSSRVRQTFLDFPSA